MDSESPLPSKRLRVSLNGNLHMTECVREFKLPRQFPSMVTKVSSEASNDKNKVRPNFNTAVTCLPKTPIHTKIVANQEIPGPSFIRKIKIKGKDGRDLGELNVQDLPQNIQGKTITLAKNGIIKPPEIITPDKSKGITIGVLTPINILKSEKPFVTSSSSIPCVNKDQKESKDIGKDSKKPMIIAQQQINDNKKPIIIAQQQINDNKKPIIIAQQQINDNKKPIIIAQQQINDSKKPIIIEQKQMSAVMDPQGRPQVLVFQSGKNWHMVKLSTTAPVNGSQNGKNIVLEKLPSLPNCGKATILQVKDQSQNVVAKESFQNGSDTLPVGSKISSTNCSNTSTKRWPMWEAEKNPTERCKKKFPIVATENGEFRPKIEISRVFGPSGSKLVSSKHMTSQIQTADKLPPENMNSPTSARNSPRNNASLKQDEMVVLPSDIPDSMDSDSELSTVIKDAQPINTKISDKSMLKIGKCTETAKYPATRDLFSARKDTKKIPGDGEKKDEISNRLNILTKALSTVEDKELRAKALKALADCGIGMEKLVPICPPSEMRPVKDSGTQTPVFGVIEPDHFVYVNQENPELERIRPIERKAPQKIGHIIGNPHPQELSLNTFDLPNWVTPNACDELGEMVKAYVGESEGVSEVRNILAEKPNQVSPELVSQLLVDFQTYKTFDENGLLSIHRAVINDDLRAVSRLLTIFREESPDIPTADGQTSLELAIRYEVSPKIITMLLQAGAEPTSPEIGHDSALIIASKKSLPILKELIPYVTTRKSIDNYDSSGFAALHYCAQNDNKSGVIELTNASADVNVRDRRSGRTPLFHAIENEHIELAQLLLDKGAQANIASYSGHTVFALVEEGKHYSLAESLNRIGK